MLEPFPPIPPMISTTVAVALGVLVLSLLALPIMRGLTLTLATIQALLCTARRVLRGRGAVGDPTRPLQLDGLSTSLERFTRQTRTLALELRHCSGEAVAWPAEDNTAQRPRVGWRESLLGGANSPLAETRRQVFEWLRAAETLPAHEREAVTGAGVDLDSVHRALTHEGDRPADELVRALAGLLWAADERLATVNGAGYRGNCAEHPAAPNPVAYLAGDADAEKTRRARWAGALADHGRGLSRMAGSYTRSAAEREDLEQDIALALWRALPTFRGESTLKTFAYRIAKYCCFRHLRRRGDSGEVTDPQTLADPAACIESAALRADQRARIEQALTDLPGNLESVMTMHLSGASYAQIAEALKISERNVSVRLTRARAHLRRQLVAA
ncbi:MAG: sigma-70 family RNA polymerase sigma factor [Myxococcales bacterium]|nr:sigma-70 family RNA polymerase sigma factor [Myxococcales bacterium]